MWCEVRFCLVNFKVTKIMLIFDTCFHWKFCTYIYVLYIVINRVKKKSRHFPAHYWVFPVMSHTNLKNHRACPVAFSAVCESWDLLAPVLQSSPEAHSGAAPRVLCMGGLNGRVLVLQICLLMRPLILKFSSLYLLHISLRVWMMSWKVLWTHLFTLKMVCLSLNYKVAYQLWKDS